MKDRELRQQLRHCGLLNDKDEAAVYVDTLRDNVEKIRGRLFALIDALGMVCELQKPGYKVVKKTKQTKQ